MLALAAVEPDELVVRPFVVDDVCVVPPCSLYPEPFAPDPPDACPLPEPSPDLWPLPPAAPDHRPDH